MGGSQWGGCPPLRRVLAGHSLVFRAFRPAQLEQVYLYPTLLRPPTGQWAAPTDRYPLLDSTLLYPPALLLSLLCPGHTIIIPYMQCSRLTSSMPFKIYCTSLKINPPSKCNPKWKMKTSLEVFNILCSPKESTSVGHCHYKKWS